MFIEVRPATHEDAQDLVALNVEFDSEGLDLSSLEAVRKALSKESLEKVFLAFYNGQAIGFASLQITQSFCYSRPTAELTGIFIRPESRRSGAASKLISSVVAEAERVNALELFLRVSHSNEGAITFYESSKFELTDHHEYRIKYYEAST